MRKVHPPDPRRSFCRCQRLALARRLAGVGRTASPRIIPLVLSLAASVAAERRPFLSAGVYERLLQAAARGGNLSAAYALAASYATGDSLPLRLRRAFFWYGSAARRGHAEAQFNLAAMYWEGEGTAQSVAQARYWFKRALAGGEKDAKRMLDFIGHLS